MKGRERVLTALNHKEPDRIPLDIGDSGACGIDIVAYKKLINYLGLDISNKVETSNNIDEQLACVDEQFFQYFGLIFVTILHFPLLKFYQQNLLFFQFHLN